MTKSVGRLGAALAGRYTIESAIGAGGMATEYSAEDLKHRRKVVIKVLNPESAALMGRDRFLREIAAVVSTSDKNLGAAHEPDAVS